MRGERLLAAGVDDPHHRLERRAPAGEVGLAVGHDGDGRAGAGLLRRGQLGGQRPGRLVDDLLQGRHGRRGGPRRVDLDVVDRADGQQRLAVAVEHLATPAPRAGSRQRLVGGHPGVPEGPGAGRDDAPPVGGALERHRLGVGPRRAPGQRPADVEDRLARVAGAVDRGHRDRHRTRAQPPGHRAERPRDLRRGHPAVRRAGLVQGAGRPRAGESVGRGAGRAVLLGLPPLVLPDDAAADSSEHDGPRDDRDEHSATVHPDIQQHAPAPAAQTCAPAWRRSRAHRGCVVAAHRGRRRGRLWP